MVIVLTLVMVVMEAVVAWGTWQVAIDAPPGSPAVMMGALTSRLVVALIGQLFVAGTAFTVWILVRGLRVQGCR